MPLFSKFYQPKRRRHKATAPMKKRRKIPAKVAAPVKKRRAKH